MTSRPERLAERITPMLLLLLAIGGALLMAAPRPAGASPCKPDCLPNNNCGDDGCGGSCGTCTAPATCTDIFGSRICAVECLYTCASGNQSFCLPRFHPPDCTVCTQAECDIFCTASSSTCTRIDCNPPACQ